MRQNLKTLRWLLLIAVALCATSALAGPTAALARLFHSPGLVPLLEARLLNDEPVLTPETRQRIRALVGAALSEAGVPGFGPGRESDIEVRFIRAPGLLMISSGGNEMFIDARGRLLARSFESEALQQTGAQVNSGWRALAGIHGLEREAYLNVFETKQALLDATEPNLAAPLDADATDLRIRSGLESGAEHIDVIDLQTGERVMALDLANGRVAAERAAYPWGIHLRAGGEVEERRSKGCAGGF